MSTACTTYESRIPEKGASYEIIRSTLRTFIAERVAEEQPLPAYVTKEFDAFLRCGIHAHGFLRLQCKSCKTEQIVAFSCKKRGFCPSCCAKRKVEAAVHLVDNVLPFAPYRQFVFSFPIALRYWLHFNSELYSAIHRLIIARIERLYVRKAKALGIEAPATGCISFRQNWGSALNLNPHLHILSLDGAYYRPKPGFAELRNLSSHVSEEDVASLLEDCVAAILALLRKSGYLDDEGVLVSHPLFDRPFAESEAITQASVASIESRIAFGPHAPGPVRRIGKSFGYEGERAFPVGQNCYSMNGFSLHANTRTNSYDRDRLEKLIEYIARGPLSDERVELQDDGQVRLQLKRAWSDGTTHLLFTRSEFVEKLSCLVPPPNNHLVRWCGIFAPNSGYRELVRPHPEVKKGFHYPAPASENEEEKLVKDGSWAKLLAKVFGVDVSSCAFCGALLRLIGPVLDSVSVGCYLRHIGLSDRPPARAPPPHRQRSLNFSYEPC